MDPIYQMCFKPDGNKWGLVFSSEIEDYCQPLFVIQQNGGLHRDSSYYMPGEIRGEYTNFTLIRQDDLLVIDDLRLGQPIRFADGFFSAPTPGGTTYSHDSLDYIGKHKELVRPYDQFLLLYPLDLMVMDHAYREQGACFVGLTPIFGELRENLDNRVTLGA